MKKIFRLSLVFLLTVSLILLGPISAIAEPVKGMPVGPVTPVDTPLNFVATDLTAELAAQAEPRVLSEVTAVLGIGNGALVGAKDKNGDAMLFVYGAGVLTDISDAVTGMKTINDMCFFIAGLSNPYLCMVGDDGTKAMLKTFNLNTEAVTTVTSEEFPTITSVAYDWAGDMGLAVTFGNSGFALVPGPDYNYFNIFGKEPMTAAANAISWPSYSDPYFLTGTHSGAILEYGNEDANVFTTLPDVVDIFDLNSMFGTNYGLAAGLGSDGYAKLFKMTTPDDVTSVNLPRTITSDAGITWMTPYALIGGTGGGSGHLYKWRQQAGEFIDYDYMLAGMTKVNDLSSGMDDFLIVGGGGYQIIAQALGVKSGLSTLDGLPTEGFWVIGGSGAKKLVVVSSTEFSEIIPPGDASNWECGDGTADVSFPAGAVGVGYNAIVEKVASGTPPAPGGLSLLGTSYEFTCLDGSGNPIDTFSGPVTITIHYDEADLNGISEDSLQIYWYNPASSAWEAISPCIVDKVNNTLTIQISHFSQFAIMGMTALPYTGS